ncbi:hypothetical protein HanRHA438_Chr14g0649111 [Helianthus annuus]|nr:hypothetical protein HanRHA438_Chr14g0649111 [Helianthus annuus]
MSQNTSTMMPRMTRMVMRIWQMRLKTQPQMQLKHQEKGLQLPPPPPGRW